MKILSFILATLLSAGLLGQDRSGLIMEYNLHTNTVQYFRDGAIVDQPSLSEGENLYIHITEFNPYVMRADVQVNKGSYMQTSLGYDSESYNSGGSAFSGITNLLGGLSLGSTVQGTFDNIPGSRGASQKEVALAKQKFDSMLSELSQIESKINASRNKIAKIEKVESSRDLALSDIHELKTNPLIKPSRIKEMIEEEILHSFAKDKGEQIGLTDLLDSDNLEEDFTQAVASYNANRADYISMADKWREFSGGLKLIELMNDDPQFEYIKVASDSIVSEIDQNIDQKLATPLQASIDVSKTKNRATELAGLRRMLEELQSDVFVYKFPPAQASGEVMKVHVDVKIENDSGYGDFKQLEQEIPVLGGWKITGGIGLAFGVLDDPSYTYTIREGIIVSEENDQFIPMITSFAHFYRQTARNLKLGGSFGVGFPMTGGSGLSSASFFLGPTFVLGKQQKFLLTAGVMGSKVERLGGGYEVGDEIAAFETIPTKAKYELGYFIGISYDLIR